MKLSYQFMILSSLVFGMAFATAKAGDLERPCSGQWPIPNFFEKLPSPQGGGVPTLAWSITWDAVTNSFAPGFPQENCSFSTQPVLQSIAGAMAAWNAAAVRSNGSQASDATTSTSSPLLDLPLNYTSKVQVDSNALVSQVASDGVSVITLWEPASSFAPAGGPFALGFANVATSGIWTITECDIALNTLTLGPNGTEFFSFVESVDGDIFATSKSDPDGGFVDLQGVLTHEVGHLLGMGHSLVDSVMIGAQSHAPTMFEFAQSQPFSGAKITTPGDSCDNGSWNAMTTPVGSILLGASARTLEPDDVAAVKRGYATQSDQTLGTIWGIARVQSPGPCVTATEYPALAVSVVAVKKDDPNGTRIGTISYAFVDNSPTCPQVSQRWQAVYTLSCLPPGEYYVEAQVVDSFFISTPEYIDTQCQPAGIIDGVLTSEMVTVNTSVEEYRERISFGNGVYLRATQQAESVVVNANQTVGLGTLRVENLNPVPGYPMPYSSLPPILRVGVVANKSDPLPNPRQRGVLVLDSDSRAASGAHIRLLVENVPGNGSVKINLDFARSLQLDSASTQLRQVNPLIQLTGSNPSPGPGTVIFNLPIMPGLGHTTLFAQAFVNGLQNPNTPIYTNVSHIWFTDP